MTIFNETKQQIIAESVIVCNHFFSRAQGLLFRKPLKINEACLIYPCQMIHTFGMKYAIDVAYISKDLRVLQTFKNVGSFRCLPPNKSSYYVLERIPQKTSLEVHDIIRLI